MAERPAKDAGCAQHLLLPNGCGFCFNLEADLLSQTHAHGLKMRMREAPDASGVRRVLHATAGWPGWYVYDGSLRAWFEFFEPCYSSRG